MEKRETEEVWGGVRRCGLDGKHNSVTTNPQEAIAKCLNALVDITKGAHFPQMVHGQLFCFLCFFSYLFFFVLESSTGAVETHIVPLENVCEGDFFAKYGT